MTELILDFACLGSPLRFISPETILSTRTPCQVPALLDQVEVASRRGWWAVGWIAYEAAAAFALPVHAPLVDWPLAWFALFRAPAPFAFSTPPPQPAIHLTPEITWSRFRADLAAIGEGILAGESYQVNYTFPARLEPQPPDPFALYLSLTRRHRFPFSAWMANGDWSLASFSPELFLSRRGTRLVTAPVKGTRPRSGDPAQQWRQRQALLASEKDRAEHLMIVDMARNDLGRVCRPGTVAAPHLFEARRHTTLFHLETRVHGELVDPELPLSHIFRALFPAASITGAPKHRTMGMIREREGRPRGVYTGAVGVMRPGGDFDFNVAIRTLARGGDGVWRMGVGGGIVADSEAEGEWREAADKGAFLHRLPEPFSLVETFAGDLSGEALERHLTRMASSARALGYSFQRDAGLALLGEMPTTEVVRLALDELGAFRLTTRPRPPAQTALRVGMAAYPVDRLDPMLLHKTTRRDHLEQPVPEGIDELIVRNNLGQVTEGTVRGVLVKLAGRWYAPPLADGLLPSLWRQRQMTATHAEERSMGVAELVQAEEILMGNSVRGTARVAYLEDEGGRRLR